MQIEDSGGPAPAQDTASTLFRVAGLRVIEVDTEPDGQVTVWVMAEGPTACPCCGTVPEDVHEWVITRPRDVCRGMDPVVVCWVKRRWACGEEQCPRQTFIESVPQLPPRCRITARLREQAGAEVTGRGITPAEAARHAGVSWPVAREVFAAAAGPGAGSAARAGDPPGHRRAPPRPAPVGDQPGNRPGPPGIGAVRLTVAETARLIRLARQYAAGRITRARLAFHLRWSRWRRRHRDRVRWHRYGTRLAAEAAI